jgi:type I restriction enzyme S subunit
MVADGYKQTDVGIIPEDWDTKVLAESFKFKNGLNKAKEFFGHGTPIVNYMDVYNNYGLKEQDIIGKVEVTSDEQRNYHVKKGDVFFTRTSETVDEIGLSTVVVEDVVNTVFSGFILRARPIDDTYDIDFKKYCFSSKIIRTQIMATSSYTTRALTNGTLLAKIIVPIPPKIEQQAIATALSDTDALISSLEKLISKKEAIKTATMQELLTGKKRLDGFSGEWVEKKLGIECDVITKGTTPTSIGGKFTSSGINFVKVESLRKNGTFIKNMFAYIDEDTYNTLGRSKLKDKDLLISIAGALGRVGIVNKDILPANTNQALAIVRLKDTSSIDLSYLFYYLNTNSMQKHIEATSSQGAQPNLSLEDIYNLPIIFAKDIVEQKTIALILSDMDSDIEALKTKLAKVKVIKEGMMQELLTGRIRLLEEVS